MDAPCDFTKNINHYVLLALTKRNHFVPFSMGVSWPNLARKLLAEAGTVKDFDSGRGSQQWDRLFFYYNKVLIYIIFILKLLKILISCITNICLVLPGQIAKNQVDLEEVNP